MKMMCVVAGDLKPEAPRTGGIRSTTFHGCSTSQDSPRCSTTVRWTLVEQPWNSRGTAVEQGRPSALIHDLFHGCSTPKFGNMIDPTV